MAKILEKATLKKRFIQDQKCQYLNKNTTLRHKYNKKLNTGYFFKINFTSFDRHDEESTVKLLRTSTSPW